MKFFFFCIGLKLQMRQMLLLCVVEIKQKAKSQTYRMGVILSPSIHECLSQIKIFKNSFIFTITNLLSRSKF
jgi:hypothetical protein